MSATLDADTNLVCAHVDVIDERGTLMNPQPGWYPDPSDRRQDRWWDGERWTSALRRQPPPPSPEERQADTYEMVAVSHAAVTEAEPKPNLAPPASNQVADLPGTTGSYPDVAQYQDGSPNPPPSNPLDAWKVCVFENYATFNGRATRAEYWWFQLGNMLLGFGVVFMLGLLGAPETASVIWYGTWLLGTLLPSVAVAVRRMHDTGMAGWVLLVPLANLVFVLMPSQQQPNKWGLPQQPGRHAGSLALYSLLTVGAILVVVAVGLYLEDVLRMPSSESQANPQATVEAELRDVADAMEAGRARTGLYTRNVFLEHEAAAPVSLALFRYWLGTQSYFCIEAIHVNLGSSPAAIYDSRRDSILWDSACPRSNDPLPHELP